MTKTLFFAGVICASLSANARNYFVSSTGNNANAGTSTTAPWQTLSKVNSMMSSLAGGDTVFFRRGDVFYGALNVNRSGVAGRPIVFSDYGSGAKPVITGLMQVTNWTNLGNGVFQSNTLPVKASLNLVVLNGTPQALGRFPNADAPNAGHLSYESFNGTSSITDNQLTSAINWTGAEAVIRRRLWVLDRCPISSHSGSTLSVTNTNNSSYDGTAGFGYFIQNDARTLDKMGEWFLNKSNRQLQLFFGSELPANHTVKASAVDTLVTMSLRNHISFNNLVFEGANRFAFFAESCGNIRIANCDFVNSGCYGIYTNASNNITVDKCTANYMLSNAFFMLNIRGDNTIVTNCHVRNTGTLAGMGLSGGSAYKAIDAEARSGLRIENNRVDTSGYVGIEFQGGNLVVKNNIVDYYCFVVDDAGGIYSFSNSTDANPGTVYTNRVVTNNIVRNGITAGEGRFSTKPFVSGIYLDGRSVNVDILNNTVYNVKKNGIHLNNPIGVRIKGNTVFNALNAMSMARKPGFSCRNLDIKNNIFFNIKEDDRPILYSNGALNQPVTTTLQDAIKAVGVIDSNYYSSLPPTGFTFEVAPAEGSNLLPTSALSLGAWRNFTGFDVNSRLNTAPIPKYKINSVISANRYNNGTFNSNITGVASFGTGVVSSWDNTAKVTGTGSLRVNFTQPVARRYAILHSAIGAISAGKAYVFRFKTLGTSIQGAVRVYLRKTASPYSNITPYQYGSFDTRKQQHEFVIFPTSADAGASACIEIEMNSGTTYVDDVEFAEVNATPYTVDDFVRLEYNPQPVVKNITLTDRYFSPTGEAYTGTIALQPFTSLVLIKDTAAFVPEPVELEARAVAPAISCFGGNTTATVSASGGKAPYTGTGTFNLNAGQGSLLLNFPTSRAGSYTLLYNGIGAIAAGKKYVLRFSTLGTTGQGIVRVALRKTLNPWTLVTDRQTATIGTGRKDHEFVINNPTTESSASFLIEVEQIAGAVYIDNIALFDADDTGKMLGTNRYANGNFETGLNGLAVFSSNGNQVSSWDQTGKIAAVHYFPVTDADNNTDIAIVNLVQPNAALRATATAPAISSLATTTTVTVTASGGTAPYNGTGSYSRAAGTHNFTITDANGCTSVATVTVTATAARMATRGVASPNNSQPSQTLAVYPNPSQSGFTLQAGGKAEERVVIQVFTSDGKSAYQTTGAANRNYVFGNDFAPGVYLVKVMYNTKTETLKVIKQ